MSGKPSAIGRSTFSCLSAWLAFAQSTVLHCSYLLSLSAYRAYIRPDQPLTLSRNMGYSANDAQLMSVPPYVCACFFTIAASWYADRVRKRGIFMLGFQLIAIAGFSMLA